MSLQKEEDFIKSGIQTKCRQNKTTMDTIKVTTTYFIVGDIGTKEIQYTTKVVNKDNFFTDVINSALFLAEASGGTVEIDRKDNYLHINYLNVPYTNLMERTYKVLTYKTVTQ